MTPKAVPVILNSFDDVGRRLVRIQAQPNDPKDEAWLQEILYSHPELLPVNEIDDFYAPPISIGREVGTDRGPIDNLYVSPVGGITIVETKLWKNPEKHRTVVAQVIDYAKELATWDYDRLCQAILQSSRRRGEKENVSLEDKVAETLKSSGIPLHEFQEGVATSLSQGSFLLLIVGDKISPNIALLTQAIQSAPGLGFTLALAEMQLFQTTPGSDWPLLVIPEIVGRTVEMTRGVVRVQYTQEKPTVTVTVADNDADGRKYSSTVGSLDQELFLKLIPKDLVQPFQEAFEEWPKLGGTIRGTPERMFFEMVLGGQPRKLVRCDAGRITVMLPKFIEEWGSDSRLYDSYLESLEPAPVVQAHVRSDKLWMRYEKLRTRPKTTPCFLGEGESCSSTEGRSRGGSVESF